MLPHSLTPTTFFASPEKNSFLSQFRIILIGHKFHCSCQQCVSEWRVSRRRNRRGWRGRSCLLGSVAGRPVARVGGSISQLRWRPGSLRSLDELDLGLRISNNNHSTDCLAIVSPEAALPAICLESAAFVLDGCRKQTVGLDSRSGRGCQPPDIPVAFRASAIVRISLGGGLAV